MNKARQLSYAVLSFLLVTMTGRSQETTDEYVAPPDAGPKGKAPRMQVQLMVATGNKARTMNFQEGDVGYVEKSLLHYIENTGDSDLVFLEMFKSSYYQDISLSEWLAHTPPELVMAHLRIDKATYEAIPRDEPVIVPS